MPRCYTCRKTFTGKAYRSTIGKPVCRSCSNAQMGGIIGIGSGASTGESLGLIHILNSWRSGSKKERSRQEDATTPLVRMPWKRPRRRDADDA